jgi:hypothetical protein
VDCSDGGSDCGAAGGFSGSVSSSGIEVEVGDDGNRSEELLYASIGFCLMSAFSLGVVCLYSGELAFAFAAAVFLLLAIALVVWKIQSHFRVLRFRETQYVEHQMKKGDPRFWGRGSAGDEQE